MTASSASRTGPGTKSRRSLNHYATLRTRRSSTCSKNQSQHSPTHSPETDPLPGAYRLHLPSDSLTIWYTVTDSPEGQVVVVVQYVKADT